MNDKATCPHCGKAFEDGDHLTWPILLENGLIAEQDGCTDCWEQQCADGWWEFMQSYFAVIPPFEAA